MTIQNYLQKTAQFIGIKEEKFKVEVSEKDSRIEVDVQVAEEQLDQFVGKRSENLRALQYLVRLVFREVHEDKNIVLDINQYRAKKEKELIDGVLQQAKQVKETGREAVYRKLNSYERYLVHTAVANHKELDGVVTYSADVGGRRWLTICLKENAPQSAIKNHNERQ